MSVNGITLAASPAADLEAMADVGVSAFATRIFTSLDAVREMWTQCERDGVVGAFQRLGWVEEIAAHLIRSGSEEIIVVELRDRVSGALRMLAPFVRKQRTGYVEYEWLNCRVCDYAAPILATRQIWSPQAAEAAWKAISSALPGADRIRVTGIPKQISGIPNPLAQIRAATDSVQIASGIALEGPPDTQMQRLCRPSFAKSFRKNMRQLEARGGETRLVLADTPEQVVALLDRLVDLRLNRFRKLGRFDLLTEQSAVSFYRDAALKGLRDGSVRVFGLKVGETIVAAALVLVRDGRLHGVLLGIADEDWHQFSPGMQIIGSLLIWSGQQGLDYFDMSVGSKHYKEQMGATGSVLAEIDLALTLRGKAVVSVSLAMQRLETWVRDNPRLFNAGRSIMRSVRRSGATQILKR